MSKPNLSGATPINKALPALKLEVLFFYPINGWQLNHVREIRKDGIAEFAAHYDNGNGGYEKPTHWKPKEES